MAMELLAMLKVHCSVAPQHTSFEKFSNSEAPSVCSFMAFAALMKRKKEGRGLLMKIGREL